MRNNWYPLFAAGVLGGSLVAGCSTMDGDLAEAVDSTRAPLISAPAGKGIPDQYIVVFKDHASAAAISTAQNRVMAASASSRVERAYSVIPGFAAKLDANALDELRRNPEVAYIEQDAVVQINTVYPSLADGIDRTDQRTGHDGYYDDHGFNGSGCHAYIVDTGIRTTHNEFTGRIGNGFDAVGGGVEDCQGHGTHVASTVGGTQFGMAKAATLHPVRVLNCQGSGSTSGVIAGVDFVRTDCTSKGRPCVANMSLGGGASSALDSAVANAVNAGITFVVAAGNENQSACNVSPAREPLAITVGAIDDNDGKASFSNFGSCVDIWAPGVSILGADIGSDTATQTISGTSMASPHMAGAACQILGVHPEFPPDELFLFAISLANYNCIFGDVNTIINNIMLHNDWTVGAPYDCFLNPNTCQGRCGNFDSSKSCQCDDACKNFGDCCSDFDLLCGSDPNSCVGFCGQEAPGGCFCDSACASFGDCCPDKQEVCG